MVGFNVKKTEELTSKTDRAKPRKTWTKDRTREGTIETWAARPETRGQTGSDVRPDTPHATQRGWAEEGCRRKGRSRAEVRGGGRKGDCECRENQTNPKK